MDYHKIELLTGLQRKVDYDSERDEVLEEDIDQIIEIYDTLTEEEEEELYKNL
jgi:hypothetical protein